MVDLRVDRDAPAVQTVDQVELPQGPVTVELPSVQAGRLLGQLPVVAGRGQRELADVELDVEVGVLDPVRLVEPERHGDQPAAERRH